MENRWAWIALLLASAGCDADDEETGPACVQSGVQTRTTTPLPDWLDLLLVIDDSSSMIEEEPELGFRLAFAVMELIEPQDTDGDGLPDVPAFPEIQVGVVSSDLGADGWPVSGCDRSGDGALQHDPPANADRCEDSYPSFLSWEAGDDARELASALDCVLGLGTGGCSVEQPFAAAPLGRRADERLARRLPALRIRRERHGSYCLALAVDSFFAHPATQRREALDRPNRITARRRCSTGSRGWRRSSRRGRRRSRSRR